MLCAAAVVATIAGTGLTSRNILLCVLAFLLATVAPLEYSLPVLVELQPRDHALRWMDANVHCLAVGLVTCHPLNLGDLAFTIVIVPAHNHHLIILADGH